MFTDTKGSLLLYFVVVSFGLTDLTISHWLESSPSPSSSPPLLLLPLLAKMIKNSGTVSLKTTLKNLPELDIKYDGPIRKHEGIQVEESTHFIHRSIFFIAIHIDRYKRMSDFNEVPSSPAPTAIQHNQQGNFLFGGNTGVHQQQQHQQHQQEQMQATPNHVLFSPEQSYQRSSTPSYISSQGGFYNATPAPGDSMHMQALMPSYQYGNQGLSFGHHQQYEHQLGQSEETSKNIIKDFQDMMKNPNKLINELSEKAGNPSMATLQAKLLCYGPAISNAIEEKEKKIEQETAALQTFKAQQAHWNSESGLMFFQQFGFSGEVSFPRAVHDKEALAKWIDARITNSTFKSLRNSNADIIRKIFGVHTYSDLNHLSQDQLFLILLTLDREYYHKEEAFRAQMNALKADGVIAQDFKTKSIYISGKNNYRENTHRALCAIYLDIVGDEMKGFRNVKCDQPDDCPWENPGSDYKSSDKINGKTEETGDVEMVEHYLPCPKRKRSNNVA